MRTCIICSRCCEGRLCSRCQSKAKELLNAEAKPKTTKESKKGQTQKWSDKVVQKKGK